MIAEPAKKGQNQPALNVEGAAPMGVSVLGPCAGHLPDLPMVGRLAFRLRLVESRPRKPHEPTVVREPLLADASSPRQCLPVP